MYKLIDEGPKPLIAANTVDFYANIIKNYFFYIYIYIYCGKRGNGNYRMEKVQLQNWLQPQATNSLNKINITAYFENLTVELHVLYALNTHVNFCVNRMLFTI